MCGLRHDCSAFTCSSRAGYQQGGVDYVGEGNNAKGKGDEEVTIVCSR